MMDAKRLFLYGALFFVSLMLWTAWQKDYGRIAPPEKTVASQKASSGTFVPASNTVSQNNTSAVARTPSAYQAAPTQRLIHVKTDLLDVTIDRLGGNVVGAKLLAFNETIKNNQNKVTLLNEQAGRIYLAQSGFSRAGDDNAAPILYNSAASNYVLDNGAASLHVVLTGKNANGLVVKKTITFKRNQYVMDVTSELQNASNSLWKGNLFSQILREKNGGSKASVFNIASYVGASLSDPGNKLYEKVSYKAMRKDPLNRTIKGGWIAMQQHYFLSAWIPPKEQNSHVYSHVSDKGIYTIGFLGPQISLAPGKTITQSSQLYVGPENAERLQAIAPGLDRTLDFGFLWPLSSLIFTIMSFLYRYVHNWGWVIVLTTLLIKLSLHWLSAKSYRSMANMKKLQPRMLALKERYGDDKQKLSQATMELYKKEKINPLGGCLPLLIQIPFFIALYWVLLESVELRHAPFILWINDLAAADPFYSLPVLMGATMLLQQKLSPAPPDPMQAKMMLLMPIVFTVLFINFPAGLVLYMTVNNAVSILQQWTITRNIEAAEKVKKRTQR